MLKKKVRVGFPLLRRNSLEDLLEVDSVLQVVPAYEIVDADADYDSDDCGD
jgi:hypothetical protein